MLDRIDNLDKKILNIIMRNARIASRMSLSSVAYLGPQSTSAFSASWT